MESLFRRKKYSYKTTLLKWRDGSGATAVYDSYFEDENDYDLDDENYEELRLFVLKRLKRQASRPIYVTKDNYFTVSYHNFPEEIILDGEVIN